MHGASDKKQYITGYMETCQMRRTAIQPPLQTEAAQYKTKFTFAAQCVDLPLAN